MQSIEPNWNGMPTIVEYKIESGCKFENTLTAGWATIIIDSDFINEMNLIADELKDDENLKFITRYQVIFHQLKTMINQEKKHMQVIMLLMKMV